jgi:Na+/H+-dicarboxylate symporter
LKLSFAAQVFASIIAGIICGLFFWEKTQILAPIGDIFIKLIQIAIVPSIVIFIITGIGSINQADAKEFLKKVALIMLLMWFLGLVVFFFMQLPFPICQTILFSALPRFRCLRVWISSTFLYHPTRSTPSPKAHPGRRSLLLAVRIFAYGR